MQRIETMLCVIAVALAVSGSVGLCFLALARQRVAMEDSAAGYHDRLNRQSGRMMLGPRGLIERTNDADERSAKGVTRPEDLK